MVMVVENNNASLIDDPIISTVEEDIVNHLQSDSDQLESKFYFFIIQKNQVWFHKNFLLVKQLHI